MDDSQLSLVKELQEFTGLQDEKRANEILESSKWDLQAAIESVLAWQDVPEMQDLNQYEPYYESQREDDSLSTRKLHFEIKFGEQTYPVPMENCFHVGDIKDKLKALLNIPVDKMKLHGWKYRQDDLIFDTDCLRDLNLPDKNYLTLTTKCGPSVDVSELDDDYSNPINEQLKQTFELHIHCEGEDKPLIMKYPGTHTIRQVKEDLVVFVGPVRNQNWEGWPQPKETLRLADCGVNSPVLQLKVSKKKSTNMPSFDNDDKSTPSRTALSPTSKSDDVDVSVDIDNTAGDSDKRKKEKPKRRKKEDCARSDDTPTPLCAARERSMLKDSLRFSEVLGGNRRLIPENAIDNDASIQQFYQEFSRRYGDNIPWFYFGSLKGAIESYLTCKIKNRRLLAIYVHDDRSVLANDFCKKVFCRPEMQQRLEEEFIVWPWDLTLESNRKKFLSEFAEFFGESYASTVEKYQLPILVITSCSLGKFQVNDIIQGSSSLHDAISQLDNVVADFKDCQTKNYVIECYREQVDHQNKEYLEALNIDCKKERERQEEARRKQEQQQKEEEERRLKEEEKERQEEERRQEQLKEEARQQKEAVDIKEARRRVDAEQEESCDRPVCISFRFPKGERLRRCFRKDAKWQDLQDYLMAENYHTSRYQIASRCCQKITPEIEKNYMSLTLEELKLHGETLMVDLREQE